MDRSLVTGGGLTNYVPEMGWRREWGFLSTPALDQQSHEFTHDFMTYILRPGGNPSQKTPFSPQRVIIYPVTKIWPNLERSLALENPEILVSLKYNRIEMYIHVGKEKVAVFII